MTDEIDLLELLQADHVNLRELEGSAQLEEAVAKHLATERELLYPLVADRSVCTSDELGEMRQLDRALEQAIVDNRDKAVPDVAAIKQAIETHATVQEALFSVVREEVEPATLVSLGDQVGSVMAEAAPHIHLHMPDHGALLGPMEDVAEVVDTIEDDYNRRRNDS